MHLPPKDRSAKPIEVFGKCQKDILSRQETVLLGNNSGLDLRCETLRRAFFKKWVGRVRTDGTCTGFTLILRRHLDLFYIW